MNEAEAYRSFRHPIRYDHQFDTLFEAVSKVTRLTVDYQGPYGLKTTIQPLDSGKFLVLASWFDLGS